MNVTIEVQAGASVQRSKVLTVAENGKLYLHEVFFVPEPREFERVIIRVLRHHRLRSNSLVGEAEVFFTNGCERSIPMERKGVARCFVRAVVGDALPKISLQSPDEHSMPNLRAQLTRQRTPSSTGTSTRLDLNHSAPEKKQMLQPPSPSNTASTTCSSTQTQPIAAPAKSSLRVATDSSAHVVSNGGLRRKSVSFRLGDDGSSWFAPCMSGVRALICGN
jgi:hypothetical protein